MLESEETLSAEEKLQAQLLYEHEKKRLLHGIEMESRITEHAHTQASALNGGAMAQLANMPYHFNAPHPNSVFFFANQYPQF